MTGAAGFIGSWLTRSLLQLGATVTAVILDEPTGNNLRVLGLADLVNIVRTSVTNEAEMERAVNDYEIDTCFHLAAQAIVGSANRSPRSTFDTNVRGTWSVLEACRRSALVERIVVASSDKAYGTQPALPYTESMALLGSHPYDASKACADIVARSYHAAFDMPVVVARLANVYGGGDLNMSRLVPGTIQSAVAGERPILRSDGTPLRDYIHIDDAVSAYLTLGESANRDEVAGQAFNFGANSPITVLDMVTKTLEACGRTDLDPDIRGTGVPAGEISRQYLDSTRAGTILGWAPSVDLADGLSRSAAWYSEYLRRSGLGSDSTA